MRGKQHYNLKEEADDEKFAALRNFQQPNIVKKLRSFPRLVAQFGAFAPDTACLTSHLRKLLHKETPWVWLPDTRTQSRFREYEEGPDVTYNAAALRPKRQDCRPHRGITPTQYWLCPRAGLQGQAGTDTVW